MIKKLVLLMLLFLIFPLASAIVVNSVYTDVISPGQEGKISLELENILDEDVQDVSITLNFVNTPFIPIGTSEQSIDEIEEDEDEEFVFTIKSSSEASPGDYQLPYLITYKVNDESKTKQGAVGIKITSNPILSYSISTENPVETMKGTINLKIINKGFSDARFVSIKAIPERFTILSDKEIYIGEIESDDFETASFEVTFNKKDAEFNAIIEYVDFENKKVSENIVLPLEIYDAEKAQELGIVKKSNVAQLFLVILLVVLLIVLWRIIKKRNRLNRSMQRKE